MNKDMLRLLMIIGSLGVVVLVGVITKYWPDITFLWHFVTDPGPPVVVTEPDSSDYRQSRYWAALLAKPNNSQFPTPGYEIVTDAQVDVFFFTSNNLYHWPTMACACR